MPLLCPGCMSEVAPEATNCGVCLRPRSRQEIFKGIRELQAEAAKRRRSPLIMAALALGAAGAGYMWLEAPLEPPPRSPAAAAPETPAEPAAPAAAGPAPAGAPAPSAEPAAPAYTLTRPGSALPAAGREWTFSGRVYDLLSLKGVPGAKVSFENPATGKRTAVRTGKDGRYKVDLPPLKEGGYAVDVSHPAYRPGFLDESETPYSEQSEARRIEAGRLLRESVIMHVPLAPEDGERELTYDAVLAPLPR